MTPKPNFKPSSKPSPAPNPPEHTEKTLPLWLEAPLETLRSTPGHWLLVGERDETAFEPLLSSLIRAYLCLKEGRKNCDCASCALPKGEHPDFFHLEENTPLKVEIAREIEAFVSVYPTLSRRRLVFLPDVEHLNAASANALLKTIEEPKAQAVFLLQTQSPMRVFPTLKSRMRRFTLPRRERTALFSDLSERFKHCEPPKVALALFLGRDSWSAAQKYLEMEDWLEEFSLLSTTLPPTLPKTLEESPVLLSEALLSTLLGVSRQTLSGHPVLPQALENTPLLRLPQSELWRSVDKLLEFRKLAKRALAQNPSACVESLLNRWGFFLKRAA